MRTRQSNRNRQGSQNRPRGGKGQRKDPRGAVRDLLTRIDRIPEEHLSSRDLVSLQVIREKSNIGIVTDAHKKILERVFNNASAAQKLKKKSA